MKKNVKSILYLFAGLLLANLYSCQTTTTTSEDDIWIVANANILTMNPEQPNAEAMAIKNNKILAVGDLKSVKQAAGSYYEYYDLEGMTVTPGFIETHDHILMHGSTLDYLDITPFTCPTLKEALEKLGKEGKPNKDGWVYAWAADQTLYAEKRGPTRKELDELFPDLPVLIYHMSGHGAFVNSKALELAGITKDTPNPQGGEFVKDENGELSGFLKGIPAWLQVGKFPELSKETSIKGAKYRAERGFTTASEFTIMNSNILQFIVDVTEEGDFPVRIMGGIWVTYPGLEEVLAHSKSYENDLFKLLFVKTWTDGSTQGGTGYFTEPYYKLDSDTKEGARGTQEEFNQQVTMMLEAGFAPAIHTNGDAGSDLAINAIEYAREKTGRTDIRPHFIHCQYVRDDQFEKIKELGNIGMTFFTSHIYFWGDMHRDVLLGPERANKIASMRKAVDLGIPYAMHSDPPVTDPDALFSMWVAVNRLTSSGKTLGIDQKITPEEALKAYTIEAAKVFGIENEVGSLIPGKYADFTVLKQNPLTIDPMKIKDIVVYATIMNGQATYLELDDVYDDKCKKEHIH